MPDTVPELVRNLSLHKIRCEFPVPHGREPGVQKRCGTVLAEAHLERGSKLRIWCHRCKQWTEVLAP
ncbi:MAG: hypothetical protein NTY53_24065 [Kiritimatiellaeota bacterium]|nr:hypothetical protein [Kiritimatiellota bacterium]